jgi:4-carboxymuconolactone decarboxylase
MKPTAYPSTSKSVTGDDVAFARCRYGRPVLDGVDGWPLADVAPALAHHIVADGFGDVRDRPGLTPQAWVPGVGRLQPQ